MLMHSKGAEVHLETRVLQMQRLNRADQEHFSRKLRPVQIIACQIKWHTSNYAIWHIAPIRSGPDTGERVISNVLLVFTNSELLMLRKEPKIARTAIPCWTSAVNNVAMYQLKAIQISPNKAELQEQRY